MVASLCLKMIVTELSGELLPRSTVRLVAETTLDETGFAHFNH